MTNLAIIIGVSKYAGNTANDLPACEEDARLVKNILNESGKFTDILFVTSDVRSAAAKDKIIDFVSKYKDKNIEEVLFYFSGHGHYDGSEFYYVMSDYNSNKIKQTTLENSEIDNLLRSMKPKLTVKIVDACNSGIGYIKDSDSMVDHIKSTGSFFEKCYFMFSSHNDQSSYANKEISYFTRSLCKAVFEHESSSIRYKDIIDYISDEFQSDAKQKPLFVTQADFTEYFIEIPDSVRKLRDGVPYLGGVSAAEDGKNKLSILERVKAASDFYRDKEFIQAEIDSLKQKDLIQEDLEPLKEFFEIEIFVKESTDHIIDPDVIGAWLEKDKSVPPLFATSTGSSRPVPRRVPKGIYGLSAFSSGLFDDKDDDEKYKTVMVNVRHIDGFRYSEDLSFAGIVVSANPKYAALKKYEFHFVPIFSRTKIVVFYNILILSEIGFGRYRADAKAKWLFIESELSKLGILRDKLRETFSEFCRDVLDDVASAFGDEPKKGKPKSKEKS